MRHMTPRHSSTPYIIGCMYLSKVEESMFFRLTTSRYSINLVSKQIYLFNRSNLPGLQLELHGVHAYE